MRSRYIITILAFALALLGVRMLMPAHGIGPNTQAGQGAGMDVLQMHVDHPNMKKLPTQETNDMTFVFSGKE